MKWTLLALPVLVGIAVLVWRRQSQADRVSDRWLRDQIDGRVEFHGPCWTWPVKGAE